MAIQRQYNTGLNNPAGTISFAVDNNRYPKLRIPERGWQAPSTNSDNVPTNRFDRDNKYFNKLPPPRYSSAYTQDVSHLVV